MGSWVNAGGAEPRNGTVNAFAINADNLNGGMVAVAETASFTASFPSHTAFYGVFSNLKASASTSFAASLPGAQFKSVA